MKRATPVLIASLLAFLTLQAAVFQTGLYAYWVSPSSSAGYVETVLYNEKIRQRQGPNQIAGIGDSRMALVTKTANGLTAETGYSFGTVAVAGSTPRCWYYMLRASDPHADQYRAVVVAVSSYNDEDDFEDMAERESDLNYVLPELGWRDIAEFSRSYHSLGRQWRAAEGIALKGTIYKRDLEDFLLAPVQRVHEVRQSWRDSHLWFYDYRGDDQSVAPLTVNWEAKTVTVAAGTTPVLADGLRRRLVEPLAPQTGLQSAYMKYWLGRIYDHYRGSKTRIVFLRLPRAPWIRPDLPPTNPHSSIHELEKQPNVTVLPEHLFDELERPERFRDEMHMNQGGLDRFSELLARKMREVLGPPL